MRLGNEAAAGHLFVRDRKVSIKKASSGAIVCAPTVEVESVSSGAIIITRKIEGIGEITSGGIVLCENPQEIKCLTHSTGKAEPLTKYSDYLPARFNSRVNDDSLTEAMKAIEETLDL